VISAERCSNSKRTLCQKPWTMLGRNHVKTRRPINVFGPCQNQMILNPTLIANPWASARSAVSDVADVIAGQLRHYIQSIGGVVKASADFDGYDFAGILLL
jgi:hypothetical protein